VSITTRHWQAAETARITIPARIGQVQNLLTRISEAAAFVVPEILAIDDERIWKIPRRPGAKGLGDQAAQNPANATACAFSARGTSARAEQCRAERLRRHIFPKLTDVDMKFRPLVDETGRERPLSQSSFSSFL